MNAVGFLAWCAGSTASHGRGMKTIHPWRGPLTLISRCTEKDKNTEIS